MHERTAPTLPCPAHHRKQNLTAARLHHAMQDEGWGYGSPGAAALAQKLGKRVAEQQANQVDRGTGRKPLYQSPTPQQQQQRRSLDVGHGSSSCHASFTHKSGAAGPGGGLGAAGGPGGAGLAPLANPEQRSSPAPGLSSLLISQELGGLRRASSNEDLSTSLGSSMAGGRLGDKAGGGVTAGSGGAAGGSELAGPKPRVSAAGSLNTSLLGGALPAIKPSKLGPALHAAAEPAAGQAPVGPPWMGSSAHAAPGGPAHSRGAGAHPHPASASKRSSSSGLAHLPELGKQGAQAGAVLQQQSPLGLPAYRRSLPNYTGPPVRSSPQLLLEPWDAPGPVTPPERSPPAGSDPHLPPAHCVSSPLCDQATSTSILPSPSASLTAGGGGALQPVRPPCLFSGPPSASGTPSMVSHSPMMRKLSGLPKGEAQIAQFDITSGPTGLESSMATLIDLSPTMTDPSPTVRSSMDGLAKILLSRHSNSGPQRMGSLGLEPTATSHSPSPHGKIVLSRSSSLGHGPGSGGGSANNASNSNYGPGPGPTSGPSNRGISRLAGPG